MLSKWCDEHGGSQGIKKKKKGSTAIVILNNIPSISEYLVCLAGVTNLSAPCIMDPIWGSAEYGPYHPYRISNRGLVPTSLRTPVLTLRPREPLLLLMTTV